MDSLSYEAYNQDLYNQTPQQSSFPPFSCLQAIIYLLLYLLLSELWTIIRSMRNLSNWINSFQDFYHSFRKYLQLLNNFSGKNILLLHLTYARNLNGGWSKAFEQTIFLLETGFIRI